MKKVVNSSNVIIVNKSLRFTILYQTIKQMCSDVISRLNNISRFISLFVIFLIVFLFTSLPNDIRQIKDIKVTGQG